VLVDGVEQAAAFADYKWNNATSRFELVTTSASASNFFKVRSPVELWYNHFLGEMVDTGSLTNALHTIEVRMYASASPATEIGHGSDPGRRIAVRIDNRLPSASINTIMHDGSAVNTCGVVTSGSSSFGFDITATDPDGHLLSWRLTALWGDNASAVVASDSYDNHLGGAPVWSGTTGVVPPGPGWNANDGTVPSTHCAHTFYLDVWDRVINGFGYIHEAAFHKSITIMLP
jgi:hypothetical protein